MIRIPNTIQTISGMQFHYDQPEVNVQDVAHGLSHVCRFAGHVSRFYSVAEHSALVSRLVHQVEPSLALPALWHDAHEAYMGDLASPLKALVGAAYEDIAAKIDEEVCGFLGVELGTLRHPIIKWADEVAMVFEASSLMNGDGWDFTRLMPHREAKLAVSWYLGLGPQFARALFVDTHQQLTGGDS